MNKKINTENGKDSSLYLQIVNEGIWDWDLDTDVVFYSIRWKIMLGYKDNEIGNNSDEWFSRVHPEDIEEVKSKLIDYIDGKETEYISKYRILQKNGAYKWVETQAHAIRDNKDRAVRIMGTQVDISEQINLKQARIKLERSEKFYRRLTENSSDITFVLDKDGIIKYMSHSIKQEFKYDTETLMDKSIFDYIHPDDKKKIANIFKDNKNPMEGSLIEFRFLNKKNEWCFLEAFCSFLFGDIGISEIIMNSRDISERKHAETRLLYAAFYDSLTGLPNREFFMLRLDIAINYLQRNKNRPFVVLFLDLDRFKIINDSLGRPIGDELLIQISQRLTSSIRTTDTVARADKNVVARLGGDEFIILLEDVGSFKNAIRVVERIQEQFSQPFNLKGYKMITNVSIGVVSGEHYKKADDILRDAHIAMCRSKDKGKSKYEIFDKSMHRAVLARMDLESELRQAIVKNEFVLHYQPVVSIVTNKVICFEALIRWDNKKRGLVGPLDFIPIAEETGLIYEIGEWVLRKACAQLKDWHNDGYREIRLNVNVSTPQFMDEAFFSILTKIIKETKINPEFLCLEMTESITLEKKSGTISKMRELKNLGLKFSIDDFGTGYSSLSYLKLFPIDIIKIDRSFIKDIPESIIDKAITIAIITMAQTLGLDVVAEGVETEKQLNFLKEQGCTSIQGFYFSKPMLPDEVKQYIKERNV